MYAFHMQCVFTFADRDLQRNFGSPVGLNFLWCFLFTVYSVSMYNQCASREVRV